MARAFRAAWRLWFHHIGRGYRHKFMFLMKIYVYV